MKHQNPKSPYSWFNQRDYETDDSDSLYSSSDSDFDSGSDTQYSCIES